MKINLEVVKNVIMIVMGLFLIILVVFKTSPSIDSNKNEIKTLEIQNKMLRNSFDSLSKENIKLDSLILVNQQVIDKKEILISEANHLIDRLNKRRINVAETTLTMTADEVSQNFTKYLKSKK